MKLLEGIDPEKEVMIDVTGGPDCNVVELFEEDDEVFLVAEEV